MTDQKDSGSNRLGRQLVAARRSNGLTQVEVAAQARCSIRGLWLAERGQGSVALFVSAAAAAGSEIAGRALPPGTHLGARLAALRLRMGISRRELAARANMSRTTITALEGGQLGHLAVLERVGETLNATTWWHRDIAGRAHVCLLRGRLAFGNRLQSASFPSALIAWGASPLLKARLTSYFTDGWHLPATLD